MELTDAEVERMIADAPAARVTRFVPRHLALRMSGEAAARWLDARDAERAEADEHAGDGAIFARILGL